MIKEQTFIVGNSTTIRLRVGDKVSTLPVGWFHQNQGRRTFFNPDSGEPVTIAARGPQPLCHIVTNYSDTHEIAVGADTPLLLWDGAIVAARDVKAHQLRGRHGMYVARKCTTIVEGAFEVSDIAEIGGIFTCPQSEIHPIVPTIPAKSLGTIRRSLTSTMATMTTTKTTTRRQTRFVAHVIARLELSKACAYLRDLKRWQAGDEGRFNRMVSGQGKQLGDISAWVQHINTTLQLPEVWLYQPGVAKRLARDLAALGYKVTIYQEKSDGRSE